MPTVSGSLKLVTNSPALVSQAWVRSKSIRAAGADVIVDDADVIKVSDGVVTFECEPGPAVLALSYVGGLPTKTIPLLVGTGAAQTLGSAVQAALAADGADYTALEQLKQEMSTLLGSVLAEADKAVAVLGSVEAASVSALESKQSAADYAEAASVSASYAKSSEDSARGSAQSADTAVIQAGEARDAASQSASQAGESARAAAASASEASESADSAQRSAEQAGEAAADVAGLDVALSGKAEKSHTHAISQVDGLESRLSVVESQIPKIQVVTALPSSPDASTIYLVKES